MHERFRSGCPRLGRSHARGAPRVHAARSPTRDPRRSRRLGRLLRVPGLGSVEQLGQGAAPGGDRRAGRRGSGRAAHAAVGRRHRSGVERVGGRRLADRHRTAPARQRSPPRRPPAGLVAPGPHEGAGVRRARGGPGLQSRRAPRGHPAPCLGRDQRERRRPGPLRGRGRRPGPDREERIAVRGEPEPRVVTVRETIHGPILERYPLGIHPAQLRGDRRCVRAPLDGPRPRHPSDARARGGPGHLVRGLPDRGAADRVPGTELRLRRRRRHDRLPVHRTPPHPHRRGRDATRPRHVRRARMVRVDPAR